MPLWVRLGTQFHIESWIYGLDISECFSQLFSMHKVFLFIILKLTCLLIFSQTNTTRISLPQYIRTIIRILSNEFSFTRSKGWHFSNNKNYKLTKILNKITTYKNSIRKIDETIKFQQIDEKISPKVCI